MSITKAQKVLEWKAFLKREGACSDAVSIHGNQTFQEAWDSCERPNWMIWVLLRSSERFSRTDDMNSEQGKIKYIKYWTAIHNINTAIARHIEKNKQCDLIREMFPKIKINF